MSQSEKPRHRHKSWPEVPKKLEIWPHRSLRFLVQSLSLPSLPPFLVSSLDYCESFNIIRVMMRHIILIKNLHHHQFCHLTCRSQPLHISQAHRQQHRGGGVGVGEARLGEQHQYHNRQGILVREARLGERTIICLHMRMESVFQGIVGTRTNRKQKHTF